MNSYRCVYDHIIGMLHNFGGRMGLYGTMPRVNEGPSQAKNSPVTILFYTESLYRRKKEINMHIYIQALFSLSRIEILYCFFIAIQLGKSCGYRISYGGNWKQPRYVRSMVRFGLGYATPSIRPLDRWILSQTIRYYIELWNISRDRCIEIRR